MKIKNTIVSCITKTGQKIRNTHPISQIVAFSLCLVIIVLVVITHLASPHSQRSLFFFPLAKNPQAMRTEVRYLAKEEDMDSQFTSYVNELILGPINHAYVPIFNPGTRVLRSFIRNKDAYIDLSAESLMPEAGLPDFLHSHAIIKKNVCTNFRNIVRMYLYIEGVEVFSGNTGLNVSGSPEKR